MTLSPEKFKVTYDLFAPMYKRFDSSSELQRKKPLLAHYTSIAVL
jgi:hypothetical protein